jgi:(p)ppGpp synthase/HD superfamily hydrolase
MDPKLKQALAIAATAHRGQVRRDSTVPYIVHPVAVMLLLSYCGDSLAVLCAGVLHDVLEDTHYPADLIRQVVGDEVTDAIQIVTKDKNIKDKRLRSEDYLKRLDESNNLIALLVAAADKVSNLSDTIEQGKELTEHEAWWYPATLEVLEKHIPRHPLVKQLANLLEEIPDEV